MSFDGSLHARWELYRVLSEPVRLRLMALCAAEELTIGELADLLGDAQPKVSRHLKLLREAGLLSVRRQGTRTLVRMAGTLTVDAVIKDALEAGRRLVEADGSLVRVPQVLAERDRAVKAFFERDGESVFGDQDGGELPAYLMLLAPLIGQCRLAVDVGTGTGALLEILAPVFEQVIAVDRARSRLNQAEQRMVARGYQNVSFLCFDYVSEALSEAVHAHGGADAVFASRLLHHASRPKDAVSALARLCRPGGTVLLLDYGPHEDERLREEQADLWLGFSEDELRTLAVDGGLAGVTVKQVPTQFRGAGPDRHVPWQLLVGRTPGGPGETGPSHDHK